MLLSTKDTMTEFFLQVKFDDDDVDARKSGSVLFYSALLNRCQYDSVFNSLSTGSDCLFGHHAASIPCNRQPPTNH